MKLKYYKRINALACNLQCAEGFRSDRRAGLNYGLFKLSNGSLAMDREQASREEKFCVYCGKSS